MDKVSTEQIFRRNYTIYLLGLICSGSLSFFAIPIFVRLFGVNIYGEFSLYQSAALLIISLISSWLTQCIIRFGSLYNYKLTFFKKIISLFSCFIITVLGIVSLYFIYYRQRLIIIFLFLSVILFGGIQAIIISSFNARFKAKKSVLTDLVRTSTIISIPIVLYYSVTRKAGLIILLTAFTLSYFFSLLSVYLRYKKRIVEFLKILRGNSYFSFLKKRFYKDVEVINILTYGWPLILWFAFSTSLNIVDRFIISHYYNETIVGQYTSVYDMISKGLTLFFSPILVAGYPLISKYYNDGDKNKAYHLLIKFIYLEIAFMIPVLLIAYLLKHFFITSVLKLGECNNCEGIVIPILIGIFFWQLSMLIHKPLELLNKTKIIMLGSFIALVSNVLLNFYLIPKFGYTVAAYTTIISALIYLVFITITLLRIIDHKFLSIIRIRKKYTV